MNRWALMLSVSISDCKGFIMIVEHGNRWHYTGPHQPQPTSSNTYHVDREDAVATNGIMLDRSVTAICVDPCYPLHQLPRTLDTTHKMYPPCPTTMNIIENHYNCMITYKTNVENVHSTIDIVNPYFLLSKAILCI